VRADSKKLTQAIGNILSNAYKYSPDGGAVEIALLPPEAEEVGKKPAQIGIRITDHGIGLQPGQQARVCERFYRADTSGKIPGTGLGMSIVKEIIELHGGGIDISSKFGEGTQVTLWLPVASPETEKVGAGGTASEQRKLS
jgi:signal transduction histidine kinase